MKIVWLSDLDIKGSGYFNISVPICEGLVKKGHEVKAIGLQYDGREHFYNFSIIPSQNLNDALAIAQNLYNMWKFDVFIVAIDIPIQEQIMYPMRQRSFPYIGIMPIEADPLCFSWSPVLMDMDKVFIISEFGKQEAEKMGIQAEHLQIGIDTNFWKMPTDDERKAIRKSMGFDDDTFVVLTVADNQERKNLSAAFDMMSELCHKYTNVKYVLVTKEFQFVGWKLRDYALELEFSDNLLIFERGMDARNLWGLYAMADVFLLPSKSEGLGMPLLEAMSVGIPCVATNCTAIAELLGDNRGYLAEYDYVYRDPFGNGRRYLIDFESGIKLLEYLYTRKVFPDKVSDAIIDRARKYVEQRTWEHAIDQVDTAIREAHEKYYQDKRVMGINKSDLV